MIRVLGERFCEFGLLFIILSLACGLGSRIIKPLKLFKAGSLRHFVFSLAAGLGVFSYFVLLAGIAGLLYSWVMYLFLLAVLVYNVGTFFTG